MCFFLYPVNVLLVRHVLILCYDNCNKINCNIYFKMYCHKIKELSVPACMKGLDVLFY